MKFGPTSPSDELQYPIFCFMIIYVYDLITFPLASVVFSTNWQMLATHDMKMVNIIPAKHQYANTFRI